MKLVPVFIFILALGILISCRHPGSEPAISLRDFSNDTIQLVNHFCGKMSWSTFSDLLDKIRGHDPFYPIWLRDWDLNQTPIIQLPGWICWSRRWYKMQKYMLNPRWWQRMIGNGSKHGMKAMHHWFIDHSSNKTTAQTLFDVIPLGIAFNLQWWLY